MSSTDTSPAPVILLGQDPEKGTYHWEGPEHLVWETLPGQMFGWLSAWADYTTKDCKEQAPKEGESAHYLLDPDTEEWRAADDGGWGSVVAVADGKEKFRVRHDRVFALKSNPAGSMGFMSRRVSPYALAAQVTRAEVLAARGKGVEGNASRAEPAEELCGYIDYY